MTQVLNLVLFGHLKHLDKILNKHLMKNKFKKIKSISLMFPVYRDKLTVQRMISKSIKILKKCKLKYEIVIVDDGCPEHSGKIAKKEAKKNKDIKVIFHKKNLGYGAAFKTGLKNCKYDYIFATDGDDEYDVNDLPKLLRAFANSDLVITYRLKKKYKTIRIIISWIYNMVLRFLFQTKFKDISTGSRLIDKKIFKKIKLTSNSPFIGAELAINTRFNGYKVNEIGIHTYPRNFGTGSSVSTINIILTIKEMIIFFFEINFKKYL